jgi:hypothetical protein
LNYMGENFSSLNRSRLSKLQRSNESNLIQSLNHGFDKWIYICYFIVH